MTLKYTIQKNLRWLISLQALQALLGIVVLLILVRFVPKEDFGLMAIGTLVVYFANMFADAGLGKAIIQSPKGNEKIYSSLFWINVLISFFLAAVVIMLGYILGKWYQLVGVFELVCLLSSILIIQSLYELDVSLLEKKLSFDYLSKIGFVAFLGSSIIKILFAIFGFGVYALVFGEIGRTLLMLIVFYLFYPNRFKPSFRLRTKDVKPFLSFGGKATVGQTISYFNNHVDILLLGSLVSIEVLGAYEVLKKLVIRPFKMVGSFIGQLSYAVFSNIQKDPKTSTRFFSRNIQFNAVILFPIYWFVFFYHEALTTILLGESYLFVSNLMQGFSVLFMLYTLRQYNSVILTSRNHMEYNIVIKLLTLLGYIVSIYFGYHKGLASVLLGFIITTGILFIIEIYYIHKKHFSIEPVKNSTYLIIISCFSIFMALMSSWLISLAEFSIILKGILGAAIYFSGLFIGLVLYDKNTLHEMIRIFKHE